MLSYEADARLLRPGDAADYLHLHERTFRRMRPQLHRLRLPGGSYRYPLPFLHGLHTAVGTGAGDATARACDYSSTAQADSRIRHAEQLLSDRIDGELTYESWQTEQRMLTFEQTAILINVHLRTIRKWSDTDVLTTLRAPHRSAPYIGEVALMEHVHWLRPVDYDGNVTALVIPSRVKTADD